MQCVAKPNSIFYCFYCDRFRIKCKSCCVSLVTGPDPCMVSAAVTRAPPLIKWLCCACYWQKWYSIINTNPLYVVRIALVLARKTVWITAKVRVKFWDIWRQTNIFYSKLFEMRECECCEFSAINWTLISFEAGEYGEMENGKYFVRVQVAHIRHYGMA